MHDISPPLTERTGVWPGDTPLTREVLCELRKGDSVTLSTLRATVHLGAHADGPNHYGMVAEGIGERALETYIGACHVVEASVARGERVGMRHVNAPAGGWKHARVLIKTGTFPDPERFTEDFAAIEPALVEELADAGVRLIGIDTPSVDCFSSKDLPTHKAFLKRDVAILEGLVLRDVPPGAYELIALPLRLIGFDASPVRAVLRPLK